MKLTKDDVVRIFNSNKKILADKKELYLAFKVHPSSSKTSVKEMILSEDGEFIKIDIAAAPERGKANRELIRFLAEEFKIKSENIKIISGASDKIKLIKITKNG